MRNAALAILILAASACSAPPDADAPDASADASSSPRDAGDTSDAVSTDFAAHDVDLTDADVADAHRSDDGPTDAARPPDGGETNDAAYVRIELTDGEVLTGELVATYERWRWWDPGDGSLLYAVFDPDGFGPYPADRSFRFVEAGEILAVEAWQPADERQTYREFLRSRDIAFDRPPVEPISWVATSGESYHLEENGFGDFAWDFEVTDDAGRRLDGNGAANEDYFVWGADVVSGVSGTVIDVVQSGVDNPPGSHPPTDVAVNNLVGIALGGHFYAYYLHFQENGVAPTVEINATVVPGTRLGVTGNSGVSLEPHIHVVLLWWDEEAQRSYSVPVEFRDVETARSPRGPWQRRNWVTPESGTWVRRP